MPIDVLILEKLQENDETLTILDLRDNNLGDEDAKDLAKALASNKILTSLDLRGNNLSDEGKKHFREALATNFFLLTLEGIDDPYITKCLRRNRILDNALYLMNESGLLTENAAHANYDAVSKHQDPLSVVSALTLLSRAGLLTGANFDLLFTNSAILFGIETQDLWSRIPVNELTTERFQLIVAIAEQHTNNEAEGQAAFVHFVNRTFFPIGAGIQVAFNDRQSTHFASVNQSVSVSAKKLLLRYETQLLENGLHELMLWGNELPADNSITSKTETAKRCLKRLTANDYTYTDKVSNVSTRQLLVLSWLAIHDEANRVGSLDDAKVQFIEGLYEIQRGYNLSELGVDDKHSNDRFICPEGIFNKLMEKLQGLHPDVEVLFITKKAATLKFSLVVKEEARTYLTALSKQPTALSTELLEQIKKEGVPVIWMQISKNVADRVLDEFGALYNNSCENDSFKVLMAAAEYVDLGDLSNFEKTSTSSNKNVFFQPQDVSIEEPQSEELLRRNIH